MPNEMRVAFGLLAGALLYAVYQIAASVATVPVHLFAR